MRFFRNLDLLLAAAAFLSCHGLAADLPLHGDSVIHFASEAEAQELLAARDRFLDALSPFDRQARLEVDREVDHNTFVDFVRSQVQPWNDAEMRNLEGAIESLRPKLARFRLPTPKSVWLIKTTGREEGGAAYCRQHAIVLPQRMTRDTSRDLERLLTHELFHVLSSHDAEFRRRCYEVIGFRVVMPITLPESLREQAITNPDGPLPDAVVNVRIDSEDRTLVPILYSTKPKFDPALGGPFFKYLTFRLMVVEPHGEGWRGSLRNGEPWLVSPNEVADYGRQIGANTGYIIHPDEILADNFVHAVNDAQQLRSPQIVEGLRKVLSGK
jgi:hypothetical protein